MAIHLIMLDRRFVVSLLAFLIALARHGEAFVVKTPPSPHAAWQSSRPLHMIKNPFSAPSTGSKKAGDFPRDVKDAVARCRASVQEALSKRISRMDVEMPVGTQFGIEKTKKKKVKTMGLDQEGGVSRDDLETSDRELARIFVEMFQPLGGNAISVCFNEERQARAAMKTWKGDPSASCRIFSLAKRDKKRTKKKRAGGKGFAAKMEEAVGDEQGGNANIGPFKLPEGTELALFVSPGQSELLVIERICGEVGMGTLVVLLNARLDEETDFASEEAERLFLEEFEAVFSLCAADQEVAPGCLLHRAHPGDWMLARKPKVGPPKVVLTTKDRPAASMCAEAYNNMEVGDVEEAVENALENLANWLR